MPYSVEVGVGAVSHVVVDDEVDSLHVDSTAKEVSGDHNALAALLEGPVLRDTMGVSWDISGIALPFLLLEPGVDSDTGEVLLDEELVEVLAAVDAVHEDDALVELDGVEDVDELAVLLLLGQGHVVLLESFEGQLALIINEDIERLFHLTGPGHGLRPEGTSCTLA